MAMKKAQLFPRLVDAEAEARFYAAVNARIEENLDDPSPDVDDEEVQASIDSIIWRAEARYSGDHLTNEFETAEQEAAYNDWLRAEVEASRAEGGPYIENSVFLAEMKRHYKALAEAAEAAGSR